jgi:hypothetical protein
LPHSDIHGSTPARGSPWLFAACHVLHRLLVPRHPPNALVILDIADADDRRSLPADRHPPCTETILRRQFSGFSRHRRIACNSPGLSETTVEPINCLKTVLEISTPHTTGFSRTDPLSTARAITQRPDPTKSFLAPLNPRRRPLGRCSCEQQFPVRHTAGQTTAPPFPAALHQKPLTTDH